MAYSDFDNVATADFWNPALSGVFSDPVPTTYTEAFTPDAPLPTWDGTKYATVTDPGPPQVFAPHKYLFVATALLDVQDIYIDCTPDSSDNPSITLYGSDGEVLLNPANPLQSTLLLKDPNYFGSSPNTEVLDVDPDTGETRRISRIMWADTSVYPTVYTPVVLSGIKAIAIAGANDYPQGRITHLYGIYGIVNSTETQFWTGFEGLQTQWPFKQRMTELF